MSEKTNLAIQKAAKLLREIPTTRLKGQIRIPGFIERGDEPPTGFYERIVQPHWDSFVDMNYSEGVLLFNRLQEITNALIKRNEQKQRELHSFQMLLNILKSESDAYGLNTSLGESLGTPPQNRKPDSWMWLADHKNERNSSYSLEVSDAYKNSFSALDLPKYASFFPSQSLWQTILMRTESIGNNLQEEIIGRYDRIDLLQFRSDILERVLWELEAFGCALPFNKIHETQEKDNQIADETINTSSELRIIERGLELYDNNPNEFNNREALLAPLVEYSHYSETRSLQRFLTRKGLYPTQGQGRPKLQYEKKYLEEMLLTWREALKNEQMI